MDDLRCSQIWASFSGCWEILSFPESDDWVVTPSVFAVFLQNSLAFVPWSPWLFQQACEPSGWWLLSSQGPGRSRCCSHPGTAAACTRCLRLSHACICSSWCMSQKASSGWRGCWRVALDKVWTWEFCSWSCLATILTKNDVWLLSYNH